MIRKIQTKRMANGKWQKNEKHAQQKRNANNCVCYCYCNDQLN